MFVKTSDMKAPVKGSNPVRQVIQQGRGASGENRREAGRRLMVVILMAVSTAVPVVIIILYTVSLMVEKLRF